MIYWFAAIVASIALVIATKLVLVGLLTAIGILIVLSQIGWKRIVYWQTPLDAILTLGIPMIFTGTFSGMVSAIFAGIFVSITIALSRWWFRLGKEHDVLRGIKQ